MRSVTPVVVKVTNSMFSPAYDILPFVPMLFFYFSSFCIYHISLTVLPEFTPTMWMLENQGDKSAEGQDWEVFAECVREAMARYSGLQIDHRTNKEKLLYEEFMKGNEQSCTIDGKTFYYSGDAAGDDDYKLIDKAIQ